MNFKVKLADLNDFIRQENNCVITANNLTNNATSNSKKILVSTRDCLACSACISDAESALLESSSLDTFINIVNARLYSNQYHSNVVVSLSTIAESYLCTYYKLERVQFYAWLNSYLYVRGVDLVCDQDLALHIKNELFSLEPNKINIQCPVILFMGEKSAKNEIISQLSTSPSVEVLQAMLVKMYTRTLLKKKYNNVAKFTPMNFSSRHVFSKTVSIHVCECYDKKIELFRKEYINESQEKLIDIIISADEFFSFLNCSNINSKYYEYLKKVSAREVLYSQAVLNLNSIECVFQVFDINSYNYILHFKSRKQKKTSDASNEIRFLSGYSKINKLFQTGDLNGAIENELYICDSGCINGAGLFKLYKSINDLAKIEKDLFSTLHIIPTVGTEKIQESLMQFCVKHGFSFCVNPSIIKSAIDEW